MKYQELYASISNPLDKPTIIEDILEAYLKKSRFYSGLIKNHYDKNKDTKVTGRFYVDVRNQFYAYLFEEWRNAIFFLAQKRNYPHYRKARILVPYLKEKNPTTYDEIMSVLNGENANQTIQNALNELRWDVLGRTSGWKHIDSSYVYARTHDRNEINHRLYVNCDSLMVELFALEFMKRCKERKLKYYFKYDIYAERDDTFVVYSDCSAS